MTASFENAARWRDNRRAFQLALSDLQGTATAVGLDLTQAEGDGAGGWPHVLRAEVRSHGDPRLLASLDVGLSEAGTMLLKTSPGEIRTFSHFRARDRSFYLRRICDLLEAALPDRTSPRETAPAAYSAVRGGCP